MTKVRIIPILCPFCETTPTLCGSCGDYQCRCVVPWLGQRSKGKKILVRVHYDISGKPYRPQFLGGYEEDYPTDDEDLRWLIEGGIK